MLSKIHLKNVASYNQVGTDFSNLKKINFIYGNNGTGKSTLSKVFKKLGYMEYPECTYEGEIIEKRLVYNTNFIEENFKLDNDIPGIFTLGKEHVEKRTELDNLQKNIEKNEQDKTKIEQNTLNNDAAINLLEENFIDFIWHNKTDKKNRMNELYQQAFIGLNNSKKRFYQEYCIQQKSNKAILMEENELFESAEIVFSDEKREIIPIPILNIRHTINNNIFNKTIVGEDDLEFSPLIEKLNMHTWVHEGYKIVQNHTIEYCPFCRRTLEDELLTKLSAYFNEKFEDDIRELKIETTKYEENARDIIGYIKGLLASDNKYIDKQILEGILLKIQVKHEENLKYLFEKAKIPSNKIELNSFGNDLESLIYQVYIANEKIQMHNDTVKRIKEEREKTKRNIWRFFLNVTNEEYKKFDKEMKKLSGQKKGLDKSLIHKNECISSDQKRYDEIKESMFGISSTVIAINKQLSLYGFKNFSLEAAEDTGKYKIIRENGEDANKTLSEGEKTFVTFLYYYHVVKNEERKKMIFIDDPISSLDSTILYIVSTLIKDLIKNINMYKIEQLFISTHNTYFFKEITYRAEGSSYYIIRKDENNSSYAKRYENSPIVSSYESLWKELVELKDSSSTIIQNIMRRILENYFKFYGGIALESLIDCFEEDEKIIASSLIKWTHDGSHHIQEDLYIQQHSNMNEKYFYIFTEFFKKSGNEGHLEMMINNCINKEDINPFPILQKQGA